MAVFCLPALVIFAFLGIFSSYYRQLTKEAFFCVINKSTGKKCQAEFDTKVKAKIAGKIGKISPRFSKLLLNYFGIFSFIFLGLFLITGIYTLYGGVNFYLYGNCDGLESDNFCMFDPTSSNTQGSELVMGEDGTSTCSATLDGSSTLSLTNKDLFPTIGENKEIYFFGSYSCPYTQEMYSNFEKTITKYDNKVTFIMVETHNNSLFNKGLYCLDEDEVIEYNNLIFNSIDRIYDKEKDKYLEEEYFLLLEENGYDIEKIKSCINSSNKLYQEQLENLQDVSLQATPIVYLVEDDTTIMGPRPPRVYDRMLR